MNKGLGLRVLIVEDSPDVRWTLSELLTDEGYEVETAESAEDGLSRLAGGQFQLVITDYKLPTQTGVWMLQEAAKARLLAGSKVLLITGEANPDGVAGLKVLPKPIDPELFLREVSRILARTGVKGLKVDQPKAAED